MVCCSFVSTKFALVTCCTLPATKVCRGGQGVDASIDHELQGTCSQLEHGRLPEEVLLLLGGEGELAHRYAIFLCSLDVEI